MADSATTTLDDDQVRWLLVRTAASLARLWARVDRASVESGKWQHDQGKLSDLALHEPWLAVTPGGTAISGVIRAIWLAQGLLLDAAVATDPLDRRRVCLIIQHVSCEAAVWSEQALRAAERLGVTLAENPFKECHGSSLHTEIYRLDGTYAESAARAAQAQPKG